LATDGLWDFISDQEAVNIVAAHTETACCNFGTGQSDDGNRKNNVVVVTSGAGVSESAADALVREALLRAAKESNKTLDELKAIPQGSKRRSVHDDTTAVVIYF
jgi:pyruvate dehydrogenase phosphatase